MAEGRRTFDFSEWAKALPSGAKEILVEQACTTYDVLKDLTNDDLKEANMTQLGQRKQVLTAVQKLREQMGDPPVKDPGNSFRNGRGEGRFSGCPTNLTDNQLKGVKMPALNMQEVLTAVLKRREKTEDPPVEGRVVEGQACPKSPPEVAPRQKSLITRTYADPNPDPNTEIRLVLIGRTGRGKSTTGNTILGLDETTAAEGDYFQENSGPVSETKGCKQLSMKINGQNVKVVDTPGVCDTSREPDEVLFEIAKCLLFSAPGPSAVLFVMSICERYTKEEHEAYTLLRAMFADHIAKYMIFVFTHCEKVKDDKAMEDQFKKCKKQFEDAKEEGRNVPDLNGVLESTGRRYVRFCNLADQTTKDRQVFELLYKIKEIRSSNAKPYFEDKITKKYAEEKETRLQKIMKDHGVNQQQAWKILEEMLEAERKKRSKRDTVLKGILIGASVVVGGVLTGVTGGLAGPLAAGLVALAAGGASTAVALLKDGKCSVM